MGTMTLLLLLLFLLCVVYVVLTKIEIDLHVSIGRQVEDRSRESKVLRSQIANKKSRNILLPG
jgi:hypothetical protein